ncbi:uncharacterized protein LOC123270113 [Cotesia glomerata]|uniref:uncharacterized protein LOC123270113 n=1 Tax=Cotesia glomerata TaxID=32391 RepID=UPI001D00704D|nr:uncharacterized protein LOC123270113 [Cotesia glomerata]
MTCNPKWIEITENLLPGQTASDRPNLVARVFDFKKNALIQLITKTELFGKVIAYKWVIEFQKRGLPHLHMLLTLQSGFKIKTPDIVDKFICAEIPNKDLEPKLYDIVTRNMLHGPCGDWCLIDGKCSKKFPKAFRNETVMDENGYPFYQRKNDGMTFTRNNEFIFDNRYVVPYNKTLLLTFNCHINVEVVASSTAVKYLCKYCYKGHDQAAVTINGNLHSTNSDTTHNTQHPQNESDAAVNHDEIRDFVDARYVGPVEAVWRITSKALQDKSHSIIRLPIHLQNEQNITINEDCDETALQEALQKQSMLIDYFKLNERSTEARQYTYSEIPRHYVFKKIDNTNNYNWQPRRKHFNVIGRMYSISPAQVELFHLRLLLVNVKGAISYEDIRTVNGEVCETFTSACLALGLIEDDQEWKRTMSEAVVWMMPRQLRCLFVRILIHCQPLYPEELWEQFKEHMSEDFYSHFGVNDGNQRAYRFINFMLNKEGVSLSNFPKMPQIDETEDILDDFHTQNVSNDESGAYYRKLNLKQKEIVDFVMQAINDESDHQSNCIYIDGPGGSGKTFIYTTSWHLLKSQGKVVSTMAYTGIAATLLPNGKTVHKTFGLPVPMFSDSSSNVKPNSNQGRYLKSVDVFIWDEAPMSPRYSLEIIDRTLRHIMNIDVPFGGKMMILGGDFRQLLPVLTHATRSEMVNLSIKYSHLWRNFHKFTLSQNMRALPEEIEFSQFLLDVGDGKLNDVNDNLLLPEECSVSKADNIVEYLYGNIIRTQCFNELTGSVILSPRNVDVDIINEQVVELLNETTEKIYTAIDSTENCDDGDMTDAILPEYLNTLNPPNFPPHKLRLRKNTIVMLIRNLNLSEGLCNGTRLMVLDLSTNVLRCNILTGDKAGEIVFINRITLYCDNVYPFTFKRRQFPIKIAFCMTINKAQGQTFDRIAIDLTKDVFNHGQLYVALSRVRSWQSLNLYLSSEKEENSVKNFVFKKL